MRLGIRQQRHLVDKGCRAEFSLAAMTAAAAGVAPAVTCNSNGYRYSYCTDTQGRAVSSEFSTGNLCRRERLGYDDGGIWVDRGCRGGVSACRDSGGRTTAIAGVIGAFTLGAAIASSQNTPPVVATPPPPPTAHSPQPPAWAIGSYGLIRFGKISCNWS
jgi:hypothetical protein